MAVRGSATPGPQQGLVGPIAGFLERFRRSTGVPAAVGGEAAAELAPVFVVLDEIEKEAAARRERLTASAAQALRDLDVKVQQIVAEGRERAVGERDTALRAGLRAADAEAEAIIREAEADAAAIGESGTERLQPLVAEVLRRVLEAEP